jgi:rare lipoprotein A
MLRHGPRLECRSPGWKEPSLDIEAMRSAIRGFAVMAVIGALVAGCQSAPPPPPPAPPPAPSFSQVGIASWYGPHFYDKKTADGERFDRDGLTAAHRTLPLNTMVRVTNLENGRSVIVRINDRGPYMPRRIIDLSPRAARLLDMRDDGLARVRIETLEPQTAVKPTS